MKLPGSNLLRIASKVIGKTPYTHFPVVSRVRDDRGIFVPTYGPGVELRDIIQAVPRQLYERMGLDLDRYYIMIYTSNPLVVVDRDTSGDQIELGGQRFQLQSDTDWFPIDQWRGVLAVRQQPTGTP